MIVSTSQLNLVATSLSTGIAIVHCASVGVKSAVFLYLGF